MLIVCLDLEGVLIPEVWVEFARRSGIGSLTRTTRDEPDYDKLMRFRLRTLAEHGMKIGDIQKVIGDLSPLPGAREFLDDLRAAYQAFKALNFGVVAAGDSYNDTAMLGAADAGFFIHPPAAIADQFPQFSVMKDYAALRAAIDAAATRIEAR